MRALFITTSCASLDAEHPTGLWLEEFAVPYMAAREAGIEVTVASPKGGVVPIDPKTEPDTQQRDEWASALNALQRSLPLASLQDQVFDAVFLPGGHGPMVDLAHDATLHDIVQRHDAAGKIIAAVCHGPAGLVHAQQANGRPFFDGRRATGFTNTEELLSGLKGVVPFLLEDAMKASGAKFHSAMLPMTSHVERDGNVLTGQNPHSSKDIARELVKALSTV